MLCKRFGLSLNALSRHLTSHDMLAPAVVPADAEPTPAPAPTGELARVSARAEIEAIYKHVTDIIEESKKGTISDRVSVLRVANGVLKTLGTMTGETVISEESVINSPIFQRLLSTVQLVLEHHPEAAKDLHQKLVEMGVAA